MIYIPHFLTLTCGVELSTFSMFSPHAGWRFGNVTSWYFSLTRNCTQSMWRIRSGTLEDVRPHPCVTWWRSKQAGITMIGEGTKQNTALIKSHVRVEVAWDMRVDVWLHDSQGVRATPAFWWTPGIRDLSYVYLYPETTSTTQLCCSRRPSCSQYKHCTSATRIRIFECVRHFKSPGRTWKRRISWI